MTTLAANFENQKNHRIKLSFSVASGGMAIYFLAIILVVASISRIPILDQLDEIKIGIFSAEVLSAIALIFALRRRSPAIAMMAVLAVFICMRFAFGSFVANSYFDQTFALSIQESRFGLMLIALPLAYYYLKYITTYDLKKLILSYLLILAALDILVFATLASEDLLVLGLRTDNRFVCSVLVPSVCVILLSIREKRDKGCQSFAILASIAMLLHTVLVTTSRIETFFVLGVLGFSIQQRWPGVRLLLYAMLLTAAMYLITNMQDEDQSIAGRDFLLAFEMARNGLPWGYGTVVDAVAKRTLHLPEQFYFSDYGLLLYVLRYGLLGIIMASLLILFWLRFVLASVRLKGMILLAATTLMYLIFIPLLDYGSFNGGFLLAFMHLVVIYGKQKSEI